MGRSRSLRGVLLVAMMICGVVGGHVWGQGGYKPGPDRLLEMVPAECLFCVRINNLDQTLMQIDQYLTGVSPVGVSMLVRAQLANVLGNPQLEGVDMGGRFVVFAPLVGADAAAADKIGILVPITDYKRFTDGNPNVGDPDEKGVVKIDSKQTGTLSAVRVGSYVLVGQNESEKELLATSQAIAGGQLKSLGRALDADQIRQAASEQIWVYGNIPAVEKAFGVLLRMKMEEAKKALGQATAASPTPMVNPGMAMDMYGVLIDTFMKETKSVTISVRAKPAVAGVRLTVSALPGTDMASMFVSDSSAAQKNNLLGYLRDGAMMNFAFKMGPFWKKFNENSIDLLTAMTGKGMSAEDTAKMKAMLADTAACMGGSAVLSMSVDTKNKPPFSIRYVLALKDQDKYYRLTEQAFTMVNSGPIAEMYKGFGLKVACNFKRGVAQYKGAAIDAVQFAISAVDANAPEAKMITAIYGQGFDGRQAIVDGLSLLAFGSNCDALVRELIDQVKAGGSGAVPGEVKSAMEATGQTEQADLLVTYNLLRIFQMVSGMAMPMPTPMPQIDIPSRSNMAIAGTVGSGRMNIDVALPKEHLMEMSQFFQRMQQQQMQIRQQQMQNRQRQGGAGSQGPMQ